MLLEAPSYTRSKRTRTLVVWNAIASNLHFFLFWTWFIYGQVTQTSYKATLQVTDDSDTTYDVLWTANVVPLITAFFHALAWACLYGDLTQYKVNGDKLDPYKGDLSQLKNVRWGYAFYEWVPIALCWIAYYPWKFVMWLYFVFTRTEQRYIKLNPYEGDSWNEDYVKHYINAGSEPFRWIEYTITAGLVVWNIAIFSGVFNLWALLGLLVANAVVQLTGYLHEIHNKEQFINEPQPAKTWTAFIVGSVAFAVIFIVIFVSFYSLDAENIPDFVYWLLWGVFALFCVFPLIMIVFWLTRSGAARAPMSPITYALLWIVASFVSKTFFDAVTNIGANSIQN